jgi:hypothetical protein
MRPAVTRTNLYSYLVTRHTGRAVRLSIEERLAEYDRHVLTVLDFGNVPLIDFSCADEVVAKLVGRTPADDDWIGERFFLLGGLGEHHRDPIESALRRQALAVAAQDADGRPVLLGEIGRLTETVWRAVWQVGSAEATAVASYLGLDEDLVRPCLRELERRRLLLRDGDFYVSFRWALRETSPVRPEQ